MKLPRNFRQIGEVSGFTKVYIEDYVMTYLSGITKDNCTYVRGAILFGNIEKEGRETYVFIHGAIEAQNIELDLDETVFDDMTWKHIYEMKEQYFPHCQIVGWYLCRLGMSVRLNDKVKKTHFENFPGNAKVLYVIDPLEEDEALYVYHGQDLIRQQGYYIYYIKNKEMREYLQSEEKKIEMAKAYETMIQDKKKEGIVRKPDHNKQRTKGFSRFFGKMIAAGIMMFLLGMTGTYVIFGTQDRARQAVETITYALQGKKSTESTSIEKEKDNEKEIGSGIPQKDKVYIVQDGDTLTNISIALFGSDEYIKEIMKVNHLEEGSHIYPGQELQIPIIK